MRFVKKHWIIVSVAVVLVVLASFILFKEDDVEHDFIVAERMDLIQEVSLTGRVKSAEAVDLAFLNSGRVARVYKDVGEKTEKEDLLLKLENFDIEAKLAQARADVKVEEATLNELIAGTRPEELEVQNVEVQSAVVALDDSKKNLANKIQDSYTKSEDAIRNKVDRFISNPRSSNPQLTFLVVGQQKTDIESGRVMVEGLLVSWKDSLDALLLEDVLAVNVNEAKNNLDQIKSFLEDVALAVNSLTEGASLSKTTIDGYKSDVSTARTNVNTAISNLLSANEKSRNAESSLALEKSELALKKAGSTSEEVTAQEAKLEKANASVKNYLTEIEKTFIRAPIVGVVSMQDAKVGEIVSANEVLISLIGNDQFEIEANVPEADIAKIEIGDKAEVTLDAYGSDVIFKSEVVKIDPAETILEGVATYRTILYFLTGDSRVRPGMTANIDISTGSRRDVIAIPLRAVVSKNGIKIVRVLQNSELKEIEVVIGLPDP